MDEQITRAMLNEIVAALGLGSGLAVQARFTGEDTLPSCFPVTELAAATIAAAGLALADLVGSETADVKVDSRLASLWFGFSIRPQGWELPSPWDSIAGDYRTSEGWIKLHTNAPHHKAAALRVLGCAEDRDAVASAVVQWSGRDLEQAVVDEGGCAAMLRTGEEWLAHPPGSAVASEPLVLWDQAPAGQSSHWQPSRERPLAGLRVLDLTRVLAGPVATRFLAGYGAQVLRIDPPSWDEPGVIPEVTLGKRCARLDLRDPEGRSTFERLLSEADVLVHGYRGDALDRLGLGASARQAMRPGLIDVSLDAYGHSGPWATRRGFDSLVQFSCGIAAQGMAWRSADAPVSLPVQALDQATGYLMAAAVIRGVAARLRGERFARARLSLARTAHLLCSHRGQPSEKAFSQDDAYDLADEIEATTWGPVRRIGSPITVNGSKLRWDCPAVPLGSHMPEWAGR